MVADIGTLGACQLALIMARTSGLTAVAPLLGSRAVSARVRLVVALALALLILPTQWSRPVDGSPVFLCMAIFRELLVGLAFGLAARLVLVATQMAGQWIGQAGGLALADTLSPDADAETSALGALFYVVALTIFLTLGGHRQMVRVLLDSFEWLPIGTVELPRELIGSLFDITSQSFQLAVRLAAPLLAALLSATLITGLVGRVLPQLSSLAMQATGNTLLTLALLALGLGSLGWLIEEHWATALRELAPASG